MEPRDPDRRHGDAAALRRPEGVKPRGGGRGAGGWGGFGTRALMACDAGGG